MAKEGVIGVERRSLEVVVPGVSESEGVKLGPAPAPTRRTSITDFLTDGSLAGLCAELEALAGVPVQLRDRDGNVITRTGEVNARGAWRVEDRGGPRPPLVGPGVVEFPLRIGHEPIGSIAMGVGNPSLGPDSRERLSRALAFLASTAGELCEHELDLRHRIKEVDAMYRVSTMLANAAAREQVLNVALDSVVEAMELDAGAIMLLKQDADGITSDREEDLTTAASRSLSKDWLDCPLPLSKDRLFDRLALNGEVVVSEDLVNDPRVLIPDRAAAEGLGAAIHAGLVFQERPIGVIRLYARRPRTFTEEDKKLLRSIARQAAVAVEQSRLMKAEEERQRVERQLELAADVQRRMLPRASPSFPRFDVAARYQPSFELGGDFYDFLDLNGHLGIVVGDVAGKGIAAALLMAAVRASLRAHVQGIYDLNDVVARVNTALCRDTRDNEFASLWYGVIDPASLRLTYCSAGHEPTLVVHVPKGRAPTQGDIEQLQTGGMVVGIDPTQTYQRAIHDLRPRDLVLAYTDGVTDARNFQGQRFGRRRFKSAIVSLLESNPEMPAQEFVDRLHWHVRQFTGLAPKQDDFTIVAMRVLEQPRPR